jgi:phosphinothricin acetyltransferase
MTNWFMQKEVGNFPIIGVANDRGQLMGFATYGSFRAWPAYKYSVEHSVYIHKDHRDKGLGRLLMKKLIITASQQQYHTMIGAIDISNKGSILFHEKLGFTHVGTIKEAAFKFNHWLDLGLYQLLLTTPKNPIDG